MERNPLIDVEPGAPRGSSIPLTRGRAIGFETVPGGLVASGWGRRDRITRRMLALADALALISALFIATAIANERLVTAEPTLYLLPTIPVWMLIFKLYGLYDRDVKRISHNGIDDIPWVFHALLVGMLLFWGFMRVLPVPQLTLEESVWFGLLGFLAVAGFRAASRAAVRSWLGPERVLLAGGRGSLLPLLRKIEQHPEYGLAPAGLLSSDGVRQLTTAEDEGPPWLGSVDQFDQIVVDAMPDRVFICRSDFHAEQVLEMIDSCRRLLIKVSILPDTLEALGPSVEVDEVEGMLVLGVNPPVLGRTSRMIKRVFDLAVAIAVLTLTAPVQIVAAVAIKLDSPGPVFFRQHRVGLGGRPFEAIKFRTMSCDAEGRRAELMKHSRSESWLDVECDPRVTRVGGLLRRTSLDELPQLWNVIRGEMSIVGPRPLPLIEDAMVGGRARGRLDLTPGVTGLWQVLGRTTIPFEEMVKLDYLYVTNWSIWMDVKLVLRTLPAVIGRRGVN